MSKPPDLLTEGYLVLATGAPKYLEMARNLAASIRLMDPDRRPICLVHEDDAQLLPEDRFVFANYAILPRHKAFEGVMNKLRVFAISPFGRTMFIDADCLMVKRDIEIYWQHARGLAFACPAAGMLRASGKAHPSRICLHRKARPTWFR